MFSLRCPRGVSKAPGLHMGASQDVRICPLWPFELLIMFHEMVSMVKLSVTNLRGRWTISENGVIGRAYSWGTHMCTRQLVTGSSLIENPKLAIAWIGPRVRTLHPFYPYSALGCGWDWNLFVGSVNLGVNCLFKVLHPKFSLWA